MVNQMTELNQRALGGLLAFLVVMGALLFVPAWTLDYWQAWIFLAVFGGSSLAITVYLMKKDPKLLQRRVKAGPGAEKQTRQKVIQSITSAGFIAILIVSALDHRFKWFPVTRFVSVAGEVLVGAGLFIIFLVYKEKHICFGHDRGCSGAESHIDGPLCNGSPPHVYGRFADVYRHTLVAGFRAGSHGFAADHACTVMATPG
jgi:hypothetical protein